jgi:hypothetical protein
MEKMTRAQFLARKKVGLILRVYATDEKDVPKRIEMVKSAVEAARKATVDGQQLIKRIDVLVWADERYGDFEKVDCGKTAGALRAKFSEEKGIFISEVRRGDLFCGILNYGVAHQLRHGVDYSLIVSSEAFSYMTPETMSAIVDAACKGALAIGVAINELTESICEGRIANTFAMWHNQSLLTVGAFDLRAAKPHRKEAAYYVKGWSKEKGEVFYHLAGVEEVLPLARLVETFGSCIAPILPQSEGVQRYEVPNKYTHPELWLRHESKIGTKEHRQSMLLAAENGYDFSWIKGGVMPGYGWRIQEV